MPALKIGITERGDAGLDLSWMQKIDQVDGLVLITKNITPALQQAILPHQHKAILHAGCTGYGQTILEPNVPHPNQQLNNLKTLVDQGFPIEHVVLRVDPIVPTEKGIQRAAAVIQTAAALLPGLTRVRVSILDMYPHVRRRFQAQNLPLPYGQYFSPSSTQTHAVDHMLRQIQIKYPQLTIEACAEPELTVPKQTGCVSQKDLAVLRLPTEQTDSAGYQRSNCLCCSAKTELLTNRTPCPHGCLYCYWKHPSE